MKQHMGGQQVQETHGNTIEKADRLDVGYHFRSSDDMFGITDIFVFVFFSPHLSVAAQMDSTSSTSGEGSRGRQKWPQPGGCAALDGLKISRLTFEIV